MTLRPAVFDTDVLALDETSVFEAFWQCPHSVRVAVGRCGVQESDYRQRRLLRARRERPCRCPADQRNQLASPHIGSQAHETG
jgi:hypothetical protein